MCRILRQPAVGKHGIGYAFNGHGFRKVVEDLFKGAYFY